MEVPMTTPDNTTSVPSDDPNTIFWQDMDTVLAQKRADIEQDMLYDEEVSKEEEANYQQIIDSEATRYDTGSGLLGVLDDTPPSPINLAGGASAPSTSNTASKMQNKINGA